MYMNPLSDPWPVAREQVEHFSRASWWPILVLGLLTTIASFVILGTTWTLENMALFFGILLLVRGVMHVFTPTLTRGAKTWNAIAGVLSILFGGAILNWPVQSLLIAAVFIGVWLVLSGLFDIVGSLVNRQVYAYWWLTLIRGIISIPLGVWALNRPFLTLTAVVLITGIWALIIGIIEVTLSFEVKRLPRTLSELGRLQPGVA